jgi:hypothetical protein
MKVKDDDRKRDLTSAVLGEDDPRLWKKIFFHLSKFEKNTIKQKIKNKEPIRILNIAAGYGTEAKILVKILRSLGMSINEVQDSLYLIDNSILMVNELKMLGFKNVIHRDFLEINWDKEFWSQKLKFDYVIGNVPFQDINGNAGSMNLWSRFIDKAVSIVKPDGFVAMISPSSWLSGGKYNPKAFKSNHVEYVDLDCATYFREVKSTFSWYIIRGNNIPRKETKCKSQQKTFIVNFDKFSFLPTILSRENISILTKVFYNDSKKLEPLAITWSNDCVASGGFGYIPGIISTEPSEEFNQELLHTNAIRLWTNQNIPSAKFKKVMFSQSGYFKPFYDDGKLGTTQVSFFYKVNSESEANEFLSYFNSKLYKYILERICKYSGFISHSVFNKLPKLPENILWTNDMIYNFFDLSQEEIDLIESSVK